jgi:hypothetical protein
MRSIGLLTCAVGLFGPAAMPAAEPAPPTQAVEFFESKVRPILAENCFSCHGPRRQQAGLRLDSRAALLKGSDGGPVLVVGEPDRSPLIKALGYAGDVKMPPRGKLPAEAVQALTAWVKMGAPWPAKPGAASPALDAAAQKHWAFQTVRMPAPPPVRNRAWVQSPIDAFVLAGLEAKGLAPAPPADRRTLLRRASFDLTGLPPTPEEIAAFEADPSPDAFDKVVKRLLASPRYGERWGRHWLDVARYADTKGYVFTEERRYPYSYTYRDYVIRAFNDDLPYDRFILEQLAADRLPQGADNRALAAMGFLRLGRRFLNNQADILDDHIDVLTRGLLGLTVSCARCHDHKFDPIPQKDYYSLYAVFASSVEPRELPVLGMPARTEAAEAFDRELKARQQRVTDFQEAKYSELLVRLRARVADCLLAVGEAARGPGEGLANVQRVEDLPFGLIRRWQTYLRESRNKHDPIWAPWHAFAALPPKDFAVRAVDVAAGVAANADSKARLNPLVARAFAGKPPASLAEVAQRYGNLFAEADRAWRDAVQQAHGKTLQALPDPDREALRQVLYGPQAPPNVPLAQAGRFFDRAVRDKLTALRKGVDQFQATSAAAPPRAMVLVDAPMPVTQRVFLRGNPNNLGEEVPRQFLGVLAGPNRKPFTQGSGRLELAQAIGSKDNPLTARVLVNRVWLHHFGAGLVRTPSDFGLRSDPPTHPELLDYLAAQFMREGWSIKNLHRLILLSSTYQQGSDGDPRLLPQDPDNRLLGRMNRQRLDFEALRDGLLAVTGQLDLREGGPPVDLAARPFTRRRTVYGFIDRQNLPGMFRTFDFASPDTHSPQRYQTTVPQQALFLMNSPFVQEQAQALIARPEVRAETIPAQRVQVLHRIVYGRPATLEEVDLALRFLGSTPSEPTAAGRSFGAWEEYAQVLLLANEFCFVD